MERRGMDGMGWIDMVLSKALMVTPFLPIHHITLHYIGSKKEVTRCKKDVKSM